MTPIFKKNFKSSFVILLSIVINDCFAFTDFDTTRFINEKREYIIQFMKQERIDGFAIAFFSNERTIWKECLGKSTYKKPINDSTLFGICSMSKSITALAVLNAVQDGLVDLDTPIIKYLPEFHINSCYEESPNDKITLRMMLSNTAGFAHEAPVGNNFQYKRSSKTEHWNSIRDTWLKFPVNTYWSYSALGFDLAAEIIEKVSKMSFETYVKEKIFIPLDMNYSTFSDCEVLSNQNRTEGYINPFIKIHHIKIPVIGAGAAYSNIDEMIKYVQFHLNLGKVNGKQMIKKEYLFEKYKVHKNFYGLGIWIARPDNNTKLKTFYLSHSGGGFGYASHMVWFPEYNLGCVILSNKMILTDDYFKIAENIITEFSLNNESIFNNKNLNLGFVPEFKERNKVKPKPSFIYLGDMDYGKNPFINNIIGKYEVAFDMSQAKWFVKILAFLGFKPAKVIVTQDQDKLVTSGFLGRSELKEYNPGLYFTEDGDAFDIRDSIPTFRNIKLRKYSNK